MLRRMIAVAFLMTVTSAVSAEAADAPPSTQPSLPRYKLQVGQALSYKSVSTFTYTGGKMSDGEDAIYRVVGAAGDGGWRIVGEVTDWSGVGGTERKRPASLIDFELMPDGRITMDAAQRAGADPPNVFPRLPADPKEMSGTWTAEASFDSVTTFHTVPATQPSAVAFASATEGIEDKIYLSSRTATISFDLARGLVTHADMGVTQNYGFHGKGAGTTDLTDDTIQPAAWIERYRRESEALVAAVRRHDDLTTAAEADGDADGSKFAEAKKALVDARHDVTLPSLAALLEGKIAAVDDEAKDLKEEAADRAAVLNKPAPDWDLVDLKGAHHALKDLRGKVVVLDFWYRGCGWCVRAMPQVKELAEAYKDKPIAVFGMNTDPEKKDADFVADVFALPYPTLRANADSVEGREGLPEQYHVRSFPTLVLIGPDGVVRDVHIGYSPTLRADLGKRIDALLLASKGG